jgi:hypothetical protein
MEKAKRKDSIKSVWSHVAKRANLFVPKSKDERVTTMSINFVLLRSPLLVPGDPDTVIVSRKSRFMWVSALIIILFTH